MTRLPPPPRLAHRMLALALPPDAREDVIGDLDEVYRRTCAPPAPTPMGTMGTMGTMNTT